MALVRKTITITEKQDAFIKAKVAAGDYASDSEVIRALIQNEIRYKEDLGELGRLIDEGLASGESDKSLDDIREDAFSRARSRTVA